MNVKQLITVTALLAVTVIQSFAGSAESLRLGYAFGRTGSGGIDCDVADAEVSAAIYIPAGMLETYAGCELSGVRAQLFSRLNVDRMEVWVRSSLEGEKMASAVVDRESDPALAKGWNEVRFPLPVRLAATGVDGLYVGVTCHQSGPAMSVAVLEEPHPDAAWLKMPGEQWSDISDTRTFCIEAVLTGDALPKNNLRLEEAVFSPYYILDRQSYEGSGTVRNLGTATVTGFDISVSMQDASAPFTKHYECDIPYNGTFSFAYDFSANISAAEGARGVTLEITKVNGEEDADTSDNVAHGTYLAVPYDMRRRVLVEEFTTEGCGNCPRVAGWLHELLESPQYSDLIVPLCHHSGYGTDWLTIPSDSEYLWFYNPQQIFAPAVMVNRMPLSSGVPPENPYSREVLAGYVDKAAEIGAEVSLSLHAHVEGESMRAIVRGSKVTDELCDNPRIVCVVTEDNVPAKRQQGAEPGYMHQHVSRSVNATWGEPVVFDGNEYEYNVELPLGDFLNIENLNLVAYIFNYDSTDRNNCGVMNAALLPFAKMTSSVTVIGADNTPEADGWYTVTGVKLPGAPSSSGLYIRRSGGRSMKIIR